MILLDYQDRRPLYEQVVEKFTQLILTGVLKSGEKMPSVRQLAIELSINPNTIQRAYMELEQQGLIYPVRGRGNFVADTEIIRNHELEEYKAEFKKLLEKGYALGLSREDLCRMMEEMCND